jgi:hypothetical protein
MSSRSDGGRAAIAGFLYQIVGVTGLQAIAFGGQSDHSTATDHEISILVQRIKDATSVTHEQYDQDAVVKLIASIDASAGDDVTRDSDLLVQFKFSVYGVADTIGRAELDKIEKAFRRGVKRAQQMGATVQGRYLVTNRRVTPDNVDWAGERGISIVQCVPIDSWHEQLRSFASRFGCADREIEIGSDSLVSGILRKIADGQNANITERHMIEAYTGNPNAAPLDLHSVFENTADELPSLMPRLGLASNTPPLRRDVVDEISALVTKQRSLIFLLGNGGCGKTVALWQWASETKGLSSPRSFVTLLPAFDVTTRCITEEICGWGKYEPFHGRQNESSDQSIERLITANPNLGLPIFFLGLDGADEIPDDDQRTVLTRVLKWFWKQDQHSQREGRDPQAVLVVTCRNEEAIEDWLHLRWAGFPNTEEKPATLSVDEFNDKELGDIAKMELPIQMALRILLSLQVSHPDGSPPNLPDVSFEDTNQLTPYTDAADLEVVKALRHPAMWRSFSSLPSHDKRSEVLNGDESALGDMAKEYIRWFSSRTAQRDHSNVTRNLEFVLRQIASHTYSTDGVHGTVTTAEWNRRAHSADYLSIPQATWLFLEALSAGLIEQVGHQEWRWRHRFVARYLADKVEYAHG